MNRRQVTNRLPKINPPLKESIANAGKFKKNNFNMKGFYADPLSQMVSQMGTIKGTTS